MRNKKLIETKYLLKPLLYLGILLFNISCNDRNLPPGTISLMETALAHDARHNYDAEFSPDGTKVAIASDDGVSIYDAANGRQLQRISSISSFVRWVGNSSIVTQPDHNLTIWHWPSNTLYGVIPLTLSSDEPHFLSGARIQIDVIGDHFVAGGARFASIWSSDGLQQTVLEAPPIPGTVQQATGVRFSADGKMVAISYVFSKPGKLPVQTDYKVILWESTSDDDHHRWQHWQPKHSISVPALVSSFAFSPDGSFFVASDVEGKVTAYSTESGGKQKSWNLLYRGVTIIPDSIEVSNDNQSVFVAADCQLSSADGIWLLDVKSGTIKDFLETANLIFSGQYSPNGKFLLHTVNISTQQQVWLRNIATKQEVLVLDEAKEWFPHLNQTISETQIGAVRFSPDGTRLVYVNDLYFKDYSSIRVGLIVNLSSLTRTYDVSGTYSESLKN